MTCPSLLTAQNECRPPVSLHLMLTAPVVPGPPSFSRPSSCALVISTYFPLYFFSSTVRGTLAAVSSGSAYHGGFPRSASIPASVQLVQLRSPSATSLTCAPA